jgi:type IV pilus assembly protein PilE
MKTQKQKGFTLIELMIAVVVIGILSAIAYPSYTAYLTRGRIAAATGGLSNWKVQMNQFYMDTKAYDGSKGGVQPIAPTSQYFDFTIPSSTPTSYMLVATGKGPMVGFTYTIDQASTKTSTNPWGIAGFTCWITKQGDAPC